MRILGLGLLVAIVASAIGAGSALASKDPYNVKTWKQYKYCPWQLADNEYPEENITDCVYGRVTEGEFKYGRISVKLNKPVVIQGGFRGSGTNIEVVPAANGGETIESAELPITGGLKVLTANIRQAANWPAALTESYEAALKAHENKVFVKIEMAGTECFTVPGCLNTEALIFQEGNAFRLTLKVKITGPWLTKLGGGPCMVGSDEFPVAQPLTSASPGRAGELFFSPTFEQLEAHNSELTNLSWHIDEGSYPTGCGGPEYESYVDDALARALEVNRSDAHGITWLTGNLHDAQALAVLAKGEKGEL